MLSLLKKVIRPDAAIQSKFFGAALVLGIAKIASLMVGMLYLMLMGRLLRPRTSC